MLSAPGLCTEVNFKNTPVILATQEAETKDLKFKASMDNLARFCLKVLFFLKGDGVAMLVLP